LAGNNPGAAMLMAANSHEATNNNLVQQPRFNKLFCFHCRHQQNKGTDHETLVINRNCFGQAVECLANSLICLSTHQADAGTPSCHFNIDDVLHTVKQNTNQTAAQHNRLNCLNGATKMNSSTLCIKQPCASR
jgi:hypothetical protein